MQGDFSGDRDIFCGLRWKIRQDVYVSSVGPQSNRLHMVDRVDSAPQRQEEHDRQGGPKTNEPDVAAFFGRHEGAVCTKNGEGQHENFCTLQ